MSKRVLFSQIPRLLRDVLVALFAGCPDIEVLGEVALHESVAAQVEAMHADVLITAEEAIGDSATFRLLRRCPELRVLMLRSGGRHACLCELRQARHHLHEISIADVVTVIRDSRFGSQTHDGDSVPQ